MSQFFRVLLIAGFLMQIFGRNLAVEGKELVGGIPPLYLMIAGIVVFTIGSIQYAQFKGRLWTWGLFGIALPLFLIVVFIPRRSATHE